MRNMVIRYRKRNERIIYIWCLSFYPFFVYLNNIFFYRQFSPSGFLFPFIRSPLRWYMMSVCIEWHGLDPGREGRHLGIWHKFAIDCTSRISMFRFLPFASYHQSPVPSYPLSPNSIKLHFAWAFPNVHLWMKNKWSGVVATAVLLMGLAYWFSSLAMTPNSFYYNKGTD